MNRQNDNISIKDVKYLNAEIIDFYPPQEKNQIIDFYPPQQKTKSGN
jgi:hypothetical protein